MITHSDDINIFGEPRIIDTNNNENVKEQIKNITKEQLNSLLKISDKKNKIQVEVFNSSKTSENSDINTTNAIQNEHPNEYIDDFKYKKLFGESILNQLIECAEIFKFLHKDDIYEVDVIAFSDYDLKNLNQFYINNIKNIFTTIGFELVNESTSKLSFKKLSIAKIKNWKAVKSIHQLV